MMNAFFARLGVGVLLVAVCYLGITQFERHAEQRGYNRRVLEDQAAEAAAQQAVRDSEARQTQTTLEAINARTQTARSNQADASNTRLERERVRVTFEQRAAHLPTAAASACTADRAAFAELLITVGQAVDQLAQDAERIAIDADGHAADSLMYQQAWPK